MGLGPQRFPFAFKHPHTDVLPSTGAAGGTDLPQAGQQPPPHQTLLRLLPLGHLFVIVVTPRFEALPLIRKGTSCVELTIICCGKKKGWRKAIAVYPKAAIARANGLVLREGSVPGERRRRGRECNYSVLWVFRRA